MNEEELLAKKMTDENKDGGISGLTEEQEKKEAEKRDIKEWGRTWIWEGYFNTKITDKWLETATMLKHVNDHVLQDIEDSIILKGLKNEMKGDKLRDFIE
jgi:hypothetical protein